MDTVFLTGAGSEPAQSIAQRLINAGYRVYGFASQFPAEGFRHPDFKLVPVNLADPASVRDEVSGILIQESAPVGVILAGNYLVEEKFEATNAEDISLALNAAVISPLTIVRALLPGLIRRRGSVLAITRTPGNAGSALAATSAGALHEFTRALFAELRDTGVKTAHIKLENNTGAPDPAIRFTNAPQSQVQPDIVADVVETILRLRENNALTEVVLRPQATREEPRLPVSAEPRLRAIQVVQLPPQSNFPPPRETIYTPERKRPDYAPPPGEEDEDDLYPEDDDNSVDPELAYLIKPSQQQRPQREQREQKPRSGAMRIHAPTPEEIAPPESNRQERPQHDRQDRRAQQGGQQQQNRRDDNRRQPQQSQQERQNHPGSGNSGGNGRDNRPQQPQPAQQSQYPQNWHWPRPPSPQQLERIARRGNPSQLSQAQQARNVPVQTPVTAPVSGEAPSALIPSARVIEEKKAPEPIREFTPPPPREISKPDIPEFVPPVSARAPEPTFEFKPEAIQVPPAVEEIRKPDAEEKRETVVKPEKKKPAVKTGSKEKAPAKAKPPARKKKTDTE